MRKVKGQAGIANVHHDLGGNAGHVAALHLRHFGFQQAVVDEPSVAFRATDGDQGVVGQTTGGVATPHHSRNAQLAGDDGRMTGSAASVGDDRAGFFHDRFPIGVGHVGHEHITGLHQIHFGQAVDQANRTGADFLTNRTALSQHSAHPFEFVAQFGLALHLALHGFRPRLQNIELAVHAVFAPFNVHRATVMRFDDQGVLRQFGHFVVGQ